jgi:hypothetical protein
MGMMNGPGKNPVAPIPNPDISRVDLALSRKARDATL